MCRKQILFRADLLKDEKDFSRTCSPLLHWVRNSEIVCWGESAVCVGVMIKRYLSQEYACTLGQDIVQLDGLGILMGGEITERERLLANINGVRLLLLVGGFHYGIVLAYANEMTMKLDYYKA